MSPLFQSFKRATFCFQKGVLLAWCCRIFLSSIRHPLITFGLGPGVAFDQSFSRKGAANLDVGSGPDPALPDWRLLSSLKLACKA